MAQKKKLTAKVLSQAPLAADIYDMWIETTLAADAKAGQFICIYTKDGSTLLPRPISICEVNADRTALRVVYRLVGAGTKEFASYTAGTSIEILGTLGNGFPIEAAEGKVVALFGGGIGIPPMLQTAKELTGAGVGSAQPAAEVHAFLGYRNDRLFLAEEFEAYSTLHIATEDGSVGTKGNVLDALKASGIKPDIIMACGPMPMLRAIKYYAEEQDIPAYISLEERMACGVGACLGCVAKTKHKDHHSNVHNARICTDGPVFEAKEVDI